MTAMMALCCTQLNRGLLTVWVYDQFNQPEHTHRYLLLTQENRPGCSVLFSTHDEDVCWKPWWPEEFTPARTSISSQHKRQSQEPFLFCYPLHADRLTLLSAARYFVHTAAFTSWSDCSVVSTVCRVFTGWTERWRWGQVSARKQEGRECDWLGLKQDWSTVLSIRSLHFINGESWRWREVSGGKWKELSQWDE